MTETPNEGPSTSTPKPKLTRQKAASPAVNHTPEPHNKVSNWLDAMPEGCNSSECSSTTRNKFFRSKSSASLSIESSDQPKKDPFNFDRDETSTTKKVFDRLISRRLESEINFVLLF